MKLFSIMQQRGYQHGKSTPELARAENLYVVVVGLPWEMMLAHEKQALRNHSQTIQRLDERGGLSADEALAVLEDRAYSPSLGDARSHARLYELLAEWLRDGRSPGSTSPPKCVAVQQRAPLAGGREVVIQVREI